MTQRTKHLSLYKKIQYYKVLWQGTENRKCFYCQVPLSLSTRTVDHLTPRALGGSNDISNLVLCCRPCNNAKADLTVAQFVEFVAQNGGIDTVKATYGKNPQSKRHLV